MWEIKPPQFPEGNKPKGSSDKSKRQSFKPKRYRAKNTWTKTKYMELKAGTNFNGWCSDMEWYVFDILPRELEKFASTMKEM